MSGNLITVRDVIRITKISKASVYRRINEGDFPQPVRVGPRMVRFWESEVVEWLEELSARRPQKDS